MQALPKTPAVSVVMPVYRPDPAYFAAAIDSVLAQTFSDWEMIIVEDPSDRPGHAVVEERRDSRIRYLLNSQRTGLARQHNRAVAEARADLIARFDADDICEPSRLAEQVSFLERHPDIDVVACQLTIIDAEGLSIGLRRYPQKHDAIVRAMHRYNPISGSNAMFRRRIAVQAGGWRETSNRPAQDYEWYSRLAARGCRFAVLPDFLVRYRRHGEQIKHRELRGTILTTLEVKRRYWLSSMDPIGLLLFAGEAVLLVMPAPLVQWLLRAIRYR
jgi:glycosyltransferase involved in cell wall biosynthesis